MIGPSLVSKMVIQERLSSGLEQMNNDKTQINLTSEETWTSEKVTLQDKLINTREKIAIFPITKTTGYLRQVNEQERKDSDISHN